MVKLTKEPRRGMLSEPEHKAAQAAVNREMSRDLVEKLPPQPEPPAGDIDMLAVGSPLPRSIGLCADLYSDVRALRLAMEKEVEVVKARESEVREHIISNLSKSDDTGAAGKRYRAQIVMKETPKLADWNKFTAFVMENDRFDLVQKRLGEKAVTDMWESGVAVPGVEKMNIPTVSITKI